MQWVTIPLGWLMKFSYDVLHHYGLAIILFTFLTKLILFPLSLWTHRNGIQMVRLEPAVNRLKIRLFGDKNLIAEETASLYKREHYYPFASVIPVLVQLLLLFGVIRIIYHPLTTILGLSDETIVGLVRSASALEGFDPAAGAAEILTVHAIQSAADPAAYLAVQGMDRAVLDSVLAINMQVMGLDLSAVPLEEGGKLLLMPVAAGVAAMALSLSQNRLNPLQATRGKISQLVTMGTSVGISLVLGFLVPAGVGFYWCWSNVFTMLQQPVLNWLISPRKWIDYDALKASRQELQVYEDLGKDEKRDWEQLAREKADYKRFFAIGNKHLVFYSESGGFYKYFERIIGYILANSAMKIHYVTSDPNDGIFELARQEEKLEAYYIGPKKLVTLFLRLEADVMVMTMSDLGNYQYKRSCYKKDINYMYLFHYPLSTHMVLHTGALRHYDTILCVGEFQFEEIRQTEKLFGDPEQRLIACGYGQLEKLFEAYRQQPENSGERKKVLIAPSWQRDNILDSCLDGMLRELLGKGFMVTVRPHPEYMKRYGQRMNEIVERYREYDGGDLCFELDFSGNTSIFSSDTVITDWSGTAYEFAFVTEKPCVFIDTPMKVNNPDYRRITVEPLEITLRDQVGIRVQPGDFDGLSGKIQRLMEDDSYREKIRGIREKVIANFGRSGEVGGQAIIDAVKEQIRRRNG